MVHELVEGTGTSSEMADWSSRRLRRGFAEKLEARQIKTVFKHIGNRFEKIWEQVDGVWKPLHECDYYDDKETGENID